MITHVLDTSAILAHYLKESGSETVNAILHSNLQVGMSILSLLELKTKLASICIDQNEAGRIFRFYVDDLLINIPVTRNIADIALEIRAHTRPRVPLVDAVIAASAKLHEAILVHRDPHLRAIPESELKQIVLAMK